MAACILALVAGCEGSGEPLTPVAFQVLGTGGQHTCAVAADGTTYCWGRGESGELGDATYENRWVPRPIGVDVALTQLSAGNRHTCGLTSDGSAFCWGWNFDGQLGNGSTVDQALPIRAGGTQTFTAISAGWFHTCALAGNGDVYCWGNNEQGQLGDGTTTRRTAPVRVSGPRMVSISAGGHHTCGVTSDGTGYCWGLNHQGQLGTGNTLNATRPARIAGDATFRVIDAGFAHGCGITNNDAAYCWGSNESGQLGVGFATPQGWPGSREPAAVVGGLAFRSITAGNGYTCAVGYTSLAHCWGRGLEGQLGNGSLYNWLTPQPVSDVSGLTAVSASGEAHACGITDANAVYCWGRGDHGQLGVRLTASASPVRVVNVAN